MAEETNLFLCVCGEKIRTGKKRELTCKSCGRDHNLWAEDHRWN